MTNDERVSLKDKNELGGGGVKDKKCAWSCCQDCFGERRMRDGEEDAE